MKTKSQDKDKIKLQRYFHSASEENHQVVKDGTPVPDRHRPFVHNVHRSQIQDFHQSVIGNEGALGFCYLSELPVEILNRIGGIDQFRISGGYLNMVESSFQFTRQDFTASGYFPLHLASNSSRAIRAISSVGAL